MEPTNYSIDVATPFQSAMQGYSGGVAIRNDQLAQQQQQVALQQQQQQQQMLSQLANNPNATGNDYARVMTAIPSLAEPLAKTWTMKNDAQQQAFVSDSLKWGAAIINGQPNIAVEQMKQRAQAMEQAAGGPTQESQAMLHNAQALELHPQLGLGIMQAALAAGGDKGKQAADTLKTLGEAARAQAQAPADLAIKNAEAGIKGAEAAVAPQKVSADIANVNSQITNRAGQLALDQDKLASETGLKVLELRRKPGAIDLPASAETIINEAAGKAQLARQSAAQMSDLADQFEKADPRALGAGTGEALANLTGQQDYVTALRKEYIRLRAEGVAKILPPGPASDKDIQIAMAGFPPETANAQQLSSFMRGMAKLQTYEAQVQDARSEWVNQVGNLGKPARDIEVGGITVPAGSTFSDYAKKALKPVGAQTAAPAVGIKERLLKTYGTPVASGVNPAQD